MELDGFRSGDCALLLDLQEAFDLLFALKGLSEKPQSGSAGVDFTVNTALSLLEDHMLHYNDPDEELE